ncbi:MAG TPA: nucleotide exchange factor GrpE [Vicinamibacterales bacterium]|jgi:molecular chaperone GrpE|nr:nucleotide exchange factor GrpE [Vicinamibacterales bacterium]
MAEEHPNEPGEAQAAADTAPGTPDAGALQRERDDFYDRLLRKTAEFDNYKRRIERERREQSDETVVSLLLEFLSIVDDFERALAVEAADGAANYKKGIELIHQKLHNMLKRQGVRSIQVLGADFDPNIHQAVMQEVSPNHREGEVIGELQRGYMMGERLLRPAMVKVAKA